MRLIKKLFTVIFWTVVLIYGSTFISPKFAELAETYVTFPVRCVFGYVFNFFDFPFFELLIILLPIAILLWLLIGRITPIIVTAQLLLISYILTLGIPSNLAPSITVSNEPTEEEYIAVTEQIRDKLNLLAEAEGDNTVETGAGNVAGKYAHECFGKITEYAPIVKFTYFPTFLSNIGTLAYFAFPTAEVVLDNTQPEFMLAFSAAHEVMHFYGVSREDEANYHAFVALSESDDSGLHLSAYLTAFAFVGSEAYKIDPDTYFEIYGSLAPRIKALLEERSAFLKSVGDGMLGSVGNALNDAAISARDERGEESYSGTSRLIVAYLR